MGTERRGFAALSKEERVAAARRGGLAANANGHTHRWTVAEAREAGRKGGVETQRRNKQRAENGTGNHEPILE